MGVIIDGQERKSVAEQVEENSKYNGRFISGTHLVLYKKDLPCFVRVMARDIDDSPMNIKAGNGTTLYTINTDNVVKDLFIREYNTNGADVWEINGTTMSKKWSNYGQDNKVLEIYSGYTNYFMVIPLRN